MSRRQADVLVKMKTLNFRPIDSWRFREGVQELQLRYAGRGNDPSLTALCEGAPNRSRSLLRGRPAQRDFVLE